MLSYNIKFPIRDDAETNSFLMMTKITSDAFSSDLMLLLLTEKGERFYNPDYGTNLIKFIFDPNDTTTESEIEAEIKLTVAKYISNLTISQVIFNWLKDENGEPISDHQLNLSINFTYNEDSFTENGQLELNF